MREVLATALLVAGVAVEVLACAGVVLMRDALDRLHYTGAGTLAAALLALAVLVRDSFSVIGNKAIVVAAFILVSSPVLTHFTAQAVWAAEEQDSA
jgi:multicomponent Na+:H+ antiporter subunit G